MKKEEILKITAIVVVIIIHIIVFSILFSEKFGNSNDSSDNCYVISLNDAVFEKAKNTLKNTGLNLIKFNAIIGKTLNSNELDDITTVKAQYDLFVAKSRRSHAELGTLGAVGCYLSHVALWKKIVDENLPGLYICESDAVFMKPSLIKSSVSEFLTTTNGHILFFGLCNKYTTTMTKLDNRFYCTHAYYITNAGAKRCLKHAMPIDEQIDSYLSDILLLSTAKDNNIINVDGPLNFYFVSIAKQRNLDGTSIQLKGIVCDK
jgi:GR25 family glycosyltransferase involved in LPS biosynthesis